MISPAFILCSVLLLTGVIADSRCVRDYRTFFSCFSECVFIYKYFTFPASTKKKFPTRPRNSACHFWVTFWVEKISKTHSQSGTYSNRHMNRCRQYEQLIFIFSAMETAGSLGNDYGSAAKSVLKRVKELQDGGNIETVAANL